jgi:hypothetical protein
MRGAEVDKTRSLIGGYKFSATLDEQRSIVAEERTEPDFVPDVVHGLQSAIPMLPGEFPAKAQRRKVTIANRD